MRASVGGALAIGLAATGFLVSAQSPATRRYGLGRPVTEAQIRGWDIDVRGDGAGLPPGQGSVAEGRVLYARRCAACHGPSGEGGMGDALVGGAGTLASAKPLRTVGSYWPFAPTIFDYVRRAMPFDAPQSLSADQTYAVVGYVLFMNHLVAATAVMNARTLPRVRMPNRNGFTRPDPRPDVP